MIAAEDLTKIRENHIAEGRMSEMLGVAQARVSNAGVRQSGASYKGYTSCMHDASFTAFDSLGVVLRCHERREEDSL